MQFNTQINVIEIRVDFRRKRRQNGNAIRYKPSQNFSDISRAIRIQWKPSMQEADTQHTTRMKTPPPPPHK